MCVDCCAVIRVQFIQCVFKCAPLGGHLIQTHQQTDKQSNKQEVNKAAHTASHSSIRLHIKQTQQNTAHTRIRTYIPAFESPAQSKNCNSVVALRTKQNAQYHIQQRKQQKQQHIAEAAAHFTGQQSSLNMSKMATPIKRKKTAKTQTRFYFATEELKPRNSILTVSNKRLKVIKKLSPKTGDKISTRGVRPATIGSDTRTGGGESLKSYRHEIPSPRTSEVPIRSDLNY
jgi:hypothetical protein